MKKLLIYCLGIAFIFGSCKNDDDGNQGGPNVDGLAVYLISEGSFGTEQAQVTKYIPDSNAVVSDIYKSVNGNELGSLIQSMNQVDDEFYLLVSGSSKIEVVDRDFNKLETITGISQPRYMLEVNSVKAYVSSFDGGIHVLDLATNAVSKTIAFPHWTENMVKYAGNQVIFSAPSNFVGENSDHIYIVDTGQDKIIDSIAVPWGPEHLVVDRNNDLWVYSNGAFGDDTKNATLSKINVETKEIISSQNMEGVLGTYNPRMQANPKRDTIFFLATTGIRFMDLNSNGIPQAYLTADATSSFYSFGIDTYRDQYYLCDGDFSSPGKVQVFNANKQKIREIEVGVGPNGILVESPE